MKIRNKSVFIISILIPLAVGSISALISGNMSSYTALNKPAFSPPGYIVYSSNSPNKAKALLIYGIQLFFNFCWSILFFGFNLYLLAFIWLIALIFIIIIMIREFYAVTPLAAYLQIPYLIWCIFAAYLNLFLFIMN